jgi:hypothetical protein
MRSHQNNKLQEQAKLYSKTANTHGKTSRLRYTLKNKEKIKEKIKNPEGNLPHLLEQTVHKKMNNKSD